MIKILNITNGSVAIHIMKNAGIEGDFLSWDDILHEGPVPQEKSLEELSTVRAKYISQLGLGEFLTVYKNFQERNRKLNNHKHYDKVTLWFEHDLYDQLQLIQLMTWFKQNLSSLTVLTFINTNQYLGESSKEKIIQLLQHDKVVTQEHLHLAEKAWFAFSNQSPKLWFQLLNKKTSLLPFLQESILRLLEEYPNTENGLSRTMHQALLIIENGISHRKKIFKKNQEYEKRKFLGDVLFWKILDELENAQLIEKTSKQHYQITSLGEDVLNNNKNWLSIKEIDRWVGGTHLTVENLWCWDIKKKTIAAYYYSIPLNSLLRVK